MSVVVSHPCGCLRLELTSLRLELASRTKSPKQHRLGKLALGRMDRCQMLRVIVCGLDGFLPAVSV